MNVSRQSSDLLPYLPDYRKFFAPLPNRTSNMKLKAAAIPLSDVQCVTQTVVKVRSLLINTRVIQTDQRYQIDLSDALSGNKEAVQLVEAEVLEFCGDWTSPAWDELDWSRVKDMTVREVLDKRMVSAATAQERRCLACPNFVTHVMLPRHRILQLY